MFCCFVPIMRTVDRRELWKRTTILLSYVSLNSHRTVLSSRSNDTWGLGCLMFEVFNGQLMKRTALKSTAKVGLVAGTRARVLVT